MVKKKKEWVWVQLVLHLMPKKLRFQASMEGKEWDCLSMVPVNIAGDDEFTCGCARLVSVRYPSEVLH